MNDVKQFEELWEHPASGWVLVELRPNDFAIYNEKTKMAKIIEDESVHDEVVTRMRQAGVRVLSREEFARTHADTRRNS